MENHSLFFSCFGQTEQWWRETKNRVLFCIFASEPGLKFFKHFLLVSGTSRIIANTTVKAQTIGHRVKVPPLPIKTIYPSPFSLVYLSWPPSLSLIFSSTYLNLNMRSKIKKSKSEYSSIFSHNLVLYAIIGNTHFLDPLGQVVFLGWYSF